MQVDGLALEVATDNFSENGYDNTLHTQYFALLSLFLMFVSVQEETLTIMVSVAGSV